MTTSRIQTKILVVEDDEPYRSILTDALESRGYEVCGVGYRADAAAAAERERPEMALVDMRLPDGSGLDVVRDLKAIDPAMTIVVLTGYGSIATALEAVRLGAVHYLTKPVDPDRILAAFDLGLAARPRDLSIETPSLAQVEWEHMQRVLSDCNGNISEAARTLNLHRRTLQRKLSKHP